MVNKDKYIRPLTEAEFIAPKTLKAVITDKHISIKLKDNQDKRFKAKCISGANRKRNYRYRIYEDVM